MYSSLEHACTCMLRAVAFPVTCLHASVPTSKGDRISLQLQIERNKGGIFPGKYPITYSAGVPMNEEDTLFQFLKGNLICFELDSFLSFSSHDEVCCIIISKCRKHDKFNTVAEKWKKTVLQYMKKSFGQI